LREETFGVIEFFSAKIRKPDCELLGMFQRRALRSASSSSASKSRRSFIKRRRWRRSANLQAGVAHDFNNILAVIMGYSNLLAEDEALKDERESS